MYAYRIAFIGQKKVRGQLPLLKRIGDLLQEELRGRKIVELYVGCDGDFEFLAMLAAIGEQRTSEKVNFRIVLMPPYPKKNDSDHDGLCDEHRHLADDKNHPKATIPERSRWILDRSNLLVTYVKPKHKREFSATLEYAEKKGIPIINLAI